PVSASFSLRRAPGQGFLPADDVEETVHRVLRRVEQEVGTPPEQVCVQKNTGYFSVSAPPKFLRKLMEQEEIATATANVQPESLLIEPVSSEPVEGPRPGSRKRR